MLNGNPICTRHHRAKRKTIKLASCSHEVNKTPRRMCTAVESKTPWYLIESRGVKSEKPNWTEGRLMEQSIGPGRSPRKGWLLYWPILGLRC